MALFTIGGQKFTVGEVRGRLRRDADVVWHHQYPFYLWKLSKSGNTVFVNDVAVLMWLAGSIMNEIDLKGDHQALAKARGVLPTNAAICYDPLRPGDIRVDDQNAINALLNNTADPTLMDNGQHTTDPETGAQKQGKISVKEFYINGPSGRRAVRRVEGQKATVYYSAGHAYNTYEYKLVMP
jgi:hypothetical protein